MAFVEEKGDLFDLPESIALAHCVAEDFHMGAGIAKVFLKKYGSKELLRSRNIYTGNTTHIISPSGRFIYYLVTKHTSWSKPTYETIESSIIALFKLMKIHGVTQIGIPLIGCGLDGLKWSIVSQLIKKHQSTIDVYVRYI